MKTRQKPVVVTVGNVKLPIYSTPHGSRERFTLAWREAGARKRKVFDHLPEARAHANEVGIKLANGQHAALTLTAADHESYVIARRDLAPFGIPLHVAIAEYLAARKLLPEGATIAAAAEEYAGRHAAARQVMSVKDAVAAFITSKKKDKLNVGYVKQLEQSLERFAAAFRVNIAAVKAAEVQAWIRQLGGAPKTQNHLRADLVSLANFSRDFLHALPPGVTEFERVGRLREPEQEIGILHPGQMAKLLAAAQADQKAEVVLWLVLGGFLGLRPAEAMRLDWNEVDLARGYLRVKGVKSKTGGKRLPPIPANAKAWLALHAKEAGPVFTHNGNERAQRYCARVGVEIPFDGLRHSYGTFRMAELQNPATVAHEMGNSPAIILKHYDKVAMPEEADAWFAIMPEAPANVVTMEAAA